MFFSPVDLLPYFSLLTVLLLLRTSPPRIHLSQLYWYEDLFGEYDPSDPDTSIFYTQFVNLFFLNVDDGVEVNLRVSPHLSSHKTCRTLQGSWFCLFGR